jgi:hypothetical protein
VKYYRINKNGENVVKFGKEEGQREKSIAYYYENFGKYLQVPDNISPRVYDLVYNLVKDKGMTRRKDVCGETKPTTAMLRLARIPFTISSLLKPKVRISFAAPSFIEMAPAKWETPGISFAPGIGNQEVANVEEPSRRIH